MIVMVITVIDIAIMAMTVAATVLVVAVAVASAMLAVASATAAGPGGKNVECRRGISTGRIFLQDLFKRRRRGRRACRRHRMSGDVGCDTRSTKDC